jgi:hypothetical protein
MRPRAGLIVARRSFLSAAGLPMRCLTQLPCARIEDFLRAAARIR